MGHSSRHTQVPVPVTGPYKRKIPDIVKAEDTQTGCFVCHDEIEERLPFLEDDAIYESIV